MFLLVLSIGRQTAAQQKIRPGQSWSITAAIVLIGCH
jgi:hypothetical protein